MKRTDIAVMALALCAVFGTASAATPKQTPLVDQVETSVMFTGTIDIEPDGSVSGYAIDEPEKVPFALRVMDRARGAWKFEPVLVDGKAAKVRTPMRVRLSARQAADGGVAVRIVGAGFGGSPNDEEWVVAKERIRPKYPKDAYFYGVRGAAYVVMRVGRSGDVEDAFVEQVNLRVVDSLKDMANWRRLLGESALATARRWKFVTPTHGEDADDPAWLVRVAFDFASPEEKHTEYGRWETYIPGPRAKAPWLAEADASVGADALAAGGIQPIGKGPRLLTPLEGS
ncbi:energy transducer TonB [Lysobacter sp. MMG2]|uniref:energy transducer TonB n=1 Tax=Lysobacter sp. MMG2 TaxID=2801338 RepID=UPI001C21FF17|nr:energy transducer TonB [Lysobacter sp. MMG2]MBU8976957.1 energy transducer TonB [Lysobacter sp. MMG2]